MIASFRHRGLRDPYQGRTVRQVAPEHVRKLRDILAALDRSSGPEGMSLLGFRLHGLKRPLKGITRCRCRVTFRYKDSAAVDVDHLD